MKELTESRIFEEIYLTSVRAISGVRPSGRTVDNTAEGRATSAVLFIWNGEATFREDRKVTVATAGDLIYIPKGLKYKMEYTAPETTFVLVNFNSYFNMGGDALLYTCIKKLLKDSADNKIAQIMTSFELASSAMDAASIFRRRELLYRLLGIAYGAAYGGTEEGEGARLSDSVLLIEKTYLESIPISELAAAAHVSENTFRAQFKKKYKTSPVQYRNRLRIARARELLSEGSCTVAEAAYGSGFENVGYFCRLYKKLTGECPGKARKSTDED